MSASPVARQACSHAQAIPSKRVLVTDASQLPEVYSSTPGGTLFSTTPGGKTNTLTSLQKKMSIIEENPGNAYLLGVIEKLNNLCTISAQNKNVAEILFWGMRENIGEKNIYCAVFCATGCTISLPLRQFAGESYNTTFNHEWLRRTRVIHSVEKKTLIISVVKFTNVIF